MAFPEAIKMMRQKQFMSQETLAKELNVTTSTVHRWETGKNVPNLAARKRIKEFCESKGVTYEPIEQSWFESTKNNKK